METVKNEGFDPEEIKALRDELAQASQSFMHVEDDDLDVLESGECVHVQFIGKHEGQEVIYDALIYTLRLHHGSMVYEAAIEQVKKAYPGYVPPEERQPGYRVEPAQEEEIEDTLTEIIGELEETEAIKVQETLEVDHDFDYGIGLDVCLNKEEITDEVIEAFIREFNDGTFKLDPTLYSFTAEEDEE